MICLQQLKLVFGWATEDGQKTDRQMEEQTDVEVEIVIHIYDLLGCTYICDISFDKGFEIILFLQSKKSKLKFII